LTGVQFSLRFPAAQRIELENASVFSAPVMAGDL
jgi:hypothetical protein